MTSAGQPGHGLSGLGHVGIYVSDLELMRGFYEGVLGLTVTDVNRVTGTLFLSSHPEQEHHELLLVAGREVAEGTKLVQQISWRADGIESLKATYRRLADAGTEIVSVVTHGNALSVYLRDPEGNDLEVYVPTGLSVPQPFRAPIQLDGSEEQILSESARLVAARSERP